MSKDLHDQIMNIACRRADDTFLNQASRLLYKEGHRDARHDAAELALAASGGNAAPDGTVISSGAMPELTDERAKFITAYRLWQAKEAPNAHPEMVLYMSESHWNRAAGAMWRARAAASAPNAALVAALQNIVKGCYPSAICQEARDALSAAGQEP